jgi:hypothetical protein
MPVLKKVTSPRLFAIPPPIPAVATHNLIVTALNHCDTVFSHETFLQMVSTRHGQLSQTKFHYSCSQSEILSEM